MCRKRRGSRDTQLVPCILLMLCQRVNRKYGHDYFREGSRFLWWVMGERLALVRLGIANTGAPEPVPQVPRPRDQWWKQNV